MKRVMIALFANRAYSVAMRPAFAIGILLACTVHASAEDTKDLAPSALKYGEAMVQHWLAVDLTQQIERAAFYHPLKTNSEINQLTAELSQTEEQLDNARALYKKLYKKEVTGHLEALDQLLTAATRHDAQNAHQAEALLTRMGQSVAGKNFIALPVSNDDLAPAWTPKLIGKDFKPKRIIFGSTGQFGDSRTLPLRFDFGTGDYGAHLTMDAPGHLSIPDKRRDRTDPVYTWLEKNHVGYHYWAGVYNNQNTYIAQWFLKQHTNDDLWMRLIDGKIPARGEWGQVNIWNPDIQSFLTNYCETQGRTFRDDPFLVCYDYTGEPHPFGSQPPGQAQYSGYNDSAVAAFHDYLKTKFKTIEHLNHEWESSYKDFRSIKPPPDPYVTLEAKATPLSYEFRLFRRDSHTALWKRIYDAYRKGDPNKPIEANVSQYMSGWPVEGLDAYGMQKAGVADWIDMHMNNFPPNLAEQIYLYSICRLTGKVPVQFEYIWSFPRNKESFDDNSESDFRATCSASVWRNLVWGKKALVFFDFYYDWPAYHNAFFDRDVDYSILRPSGCVVPTTKRKMLRFNDILMNTEVAQPPIIVLQPDASVWNSPALHPNQSFSHHINVALHGIHNVLFPKNYPFLYVPENAVLEDHYDLSKHKVIILPDAPYLPSAMTDKLLAWVKKGGTLIAYGVPGIWTPHGKDDMRLVSTIFGKSEVRDTDPGKWKWSWNLTERNGNVQLIKDGDRLRGALATWGKGKMLVAPNGFDDTMRTALFQTIDSTIGTRPAACANDKFELVLREDKRGHRYLFVLNPHTREIRQDKIILAGNFARAKDLGVGSGVPISVSHSNATTTFELRLPPGEGTAIEVIR